MDVEGFEPHSQPAGFFTPHVAIHNPYTLWKTNMFAMKNSHFWRVNQLKMAMFNSFLYVYQAG